MDADYCPKEFTLRYNRQSNGVVLQPCITWDLQLSTPLDKAYRSSKTRECVHWDQQVVMVECLRLIVLSLDGSVKLGCYRTLGAFGPAWVVCSMWLAALQSPVWYVHFRTPLLTVMRICMALASTHTNNHLKDHIYSDTPFTSAKFTLLTRYLLFPHTFSVVLEACCWPSVVLQALIVGTRVILLLFSSGAQELIRFGSSSQYQSAAADLNRGWESLLLPALPLDVPMHTSLHGRSSDVFLALMTLHMTTAAVVVYATYVSCWAQLRRWLRCKMQAAADSADSSVVIDQVCITQEELMEMHSSSAAAAVLDPCSKVWEKFMSVLLHGLFMGLVCQLALFVSKLAVFQVLPNVLPERLSDAYYPLCPGGGCGAAAAPQAAVQSMAPNVWGLWGSGNTQIDGSTHDGCWWVFLY